MEKDSYNPEILGNLIRVHLCDGMGRGDGMEVGGERMRPGRGMKGKFWEAFSWPAPALALVGRGVDMEPRSLRRPYLPGAHSDPQPCARQGLRCLQLKGGAISPPGKMPSIRTTESEQPRLPERRLECWPWDWARSPGRPSCWWVGAWVPFHMLRPPGPMGQGTDGPECSACST